MESNLNVSILINEFNAGIEAPDAASNAAFQTFVDRVFGVFSSGLFVLVDDVLEDNFDHLDNSD